MFLKFTQHIRAGDLILFAAFAGARVYAGVVIDSMSHAELIEVQTIGDANIEAERGEHQGEVKAMVERDRIVGVFGPKSDQPGGWG